MSALNPEDFRLLYQQFASPITALDCGEKCAPYNSQGVPFCCDIGHAVPAAYDPEWTYLQSNSALWRLWEPEDPALKLELQGELPPGMQMIACLGHNFCQRDFRSITCRAFPFFPYLDRAGNFLGLVAYWEYEDRCWVISNLDRVTEAYRQEFVNAFESLLRAFPGEREVFRQHSIRMRRSFGRKKRAITLLHRNGGIYKVTPRNGRLRRVNPDHLSRYGPYQIAAQLRFQDERE
jgi:hypothetical protein